MQIIYIILLFIVLACLVIIVEIGRRNFKKMKQRKAIPISEHKLKQKEVKVKLLESRLEKKMVQSARGLVRRTMDLSDRVSKFFKSKLPKFKLKGNFKINTKVEQVGEVGAQSILAEAQALLKKREIDEAEDKFIQVLKLEPKNIDAYMGLGRIYVIRRDWQTAEEAYRYIVKIKKSFLEGYRELGKVFINLKKWHELRDLMLEVINLGKEASWIYEYLAIAYRKVGYPEEAERYFEEAIELDPNNQKLLEDLLEVAILNKNKTLANKAFNTLVKLSNDEIKLQGYRDKIDIL